MKQGKSGLTVRDVQVHYQPEFELTPRKVTQWANNLPMANLGESSQSVYRMLVDVNQAIIDADKRLAILDAIAPVADQLTQSLEKQFIQSKIALNDKQKRVTALLQAIQTELALGFHSVIESLFLIDLKRGQRKQIARAIGFALYFHGEVILRCYRLYASIPKRIWKELYALFQIMHQFELVDSKVLLKSNEKEIYLKSLFSQIMLMSTASPYQLRQREIELLWQLLPELIEHITLSTHAYNNQHYVILLDSSLPPIHKSLYKPLTNESTLKLTVYPAVNSIKQRLANIAPTNQESSRKIMMLKHLIQCWNQGTHRSFARTSCEGEAKISFGLGATHYHLKQAEQPLEGHSQSSRNTLEAMEGSLRDATIMEVAKTKETANKSSFDYLSSSGAPNPDVWAKLYKTDSERAYEAKLQEKSTHSSRSKDTIMRDSYKSNQVKLLNMSPNGYCIEIDISELPTHAQTGEILGFVEDLTHENEQWNIGVIRWVRRKPKGGIVQMGVQLLAPGGRPVNVQLKTAKGLGQDIHRALILPELTGVGQPATIVTNSVSFNVNSRLKIVDNQEIYEARLSKEVAATSSFKQFYFEKIGNKIVNAPKSEKSPTQKPDDLDNFWDLV